jgi:PilZ domain-containing protein
MTSLAWGVLAALAVAALASYGLRFLQPQHPHSARATDRVPLEVPVHLRVGERALEVVSIDISRGGMCVRTDLRASAGQPVELEFALPGRPRLLLHGVVRWREPERLGVLFDIQDKRRRAVAEWIESQPQAALTVTQG